MNEFGNPINFFCLNKRELVEVLSKLCVDNSFDRLIFLYLKSYDCWPIHTVFWLSYSYHPLALLL